jgi:hypothetical protein
MLREDDALCAAARADTGVPFRMERVLAGVALSAAAAFGAVVAVGVRA